jgi:hypothetical protein
MGLEGLQSMTELYLAILGVGYPDIAMPWLGTSQEESKICAPHVTHVLSHQLGGVKHIWFGFKFFFPSVVGDEITIPNNSAYLWDRWLDHQTEHKFGTLFLHWSLKLLGYLFLFFLLLSYVVVSFEHDRVWARLKLRSLWRLRGWMGRTSGHQSQVLCSFPWKIRNIPKTK